MLKHITNIQNTHSLTHSLAHTPKCIRLFPFDVVVVCSSRYFLSIWLFCCEFFCPSHSRCVCTQRKCAFKVYFAQYFLPVPFPHPLFSIRSFSIYSHCDFDAHLFFRGAVAILPFGKRNTKLRLVWLRKLYINYNKNNLPICAVCNCTNIYQSSITRQALARWVVACVTLPPISGFCTLCRFRRCWLFLLLFWLLCFFLHIFAPFNSMLVCTQIQFKSDEDHDNNDVSNAHTHTIPMSGKV